MRHLRVWLFIFNGIMNSRCYWCENDMILINDCYQDTNIYDFHTRPTSLLDQLWTLPFNCSHPCYSLHELSQSFSEDRKKSIIVFYCIVLKFYLTINYFFNLPDKAPEHNWTFFQQKKWKMPVYWVTIIPKRNKLLKSLFKFALLILSLSYCIQLI